MVTKALKNTVKTERRKTKEADETSEELNMLENLTVSSSDPNPSEDSSVQTLEDIEGRSVQTQ